MRLVSFDNRGDAHGGVLRHGRVYPLRAAVDDDPSLDEIIRNGMLQQLAFEGDDVLYSVFEDDGVPVDEVSLLPPLERPGKLICIGLNYRSHAEEQGVDPPEMPTFFAKFPNALVPTGATVTIPPWTKRLDYEAEVAFVIGEDCKDVPEEHALRYVAAYTLLNDLSARDYQRRTPQWMPGKTFDGAAPFGPALVMLDELPAHDEIELALHLNGEEMQRSTTADLIHSVPALVAYLSKLMTLEAGDVVSTGTPGGVGFARDPRVWLAPGDEVVVSSPQLGELVTRLA